MTLQNIITINELQYYDGKLKNYVGELLAGKANLVTSVANEGNFASLTSGGDLQDSGVSAASFKTVQEAVTSPSADGNATSFIDTIAQDANGAITATKKNIPTVAASTSGEGGNAGLMTAAQAEKLAGIATGAQVNVIESISINGAAKTVTNKGVDLGSNYVQDASYVHTDNNFTDALVTKLNGIEAGGQANVLEGVKVNGTALTPTEKVVDILIAEGTANGSVKVNGTDVSVHGLGSAAFTESTAYDAAGAAADALADAIGESTDEASADTIYGAKAFATSAAASAASDKADKVASATSGNFAGLDSNGNLTDSGKKAADFATATQGGYADSALQSVSKGTDGSYVTTTVGTKSGNNGAKDQTIGVAVTVQAMSSADATHMGLAEASDVKSYIDTKVASGINYKGTVANYSALLALTNPQAGDMYNVTSDETVNQVFYPGDMNYIRTSGGTWDPSAPIVNLSTASTASIDALFTA